MKSAEKIASTFVVLVPGQVTLVPVSMLVPDPNQPRTEFEEAELKALGADLKRRGVLVPLSVRSDYVIEDGERRWRAAKLVNIEALPCLLAKPAADDNPALERVLTQAAMNDQREPLSVLDWARLLRRLVEDHKIPVKDLPDLLEQRGFKKLSRPYISNLMRLDDLPDWAQALIRDGSLTPSDGKYLLMAKPWPKAMEFVHNEIKQAIKGLREGETPHEALFKYEWEDMKQLVTRGYEHTSIELSATWGDKAPLFKWATSCKACDKRQAIGNDHFCLDETCFNQKQEHAKASQTGTKDNTSSGTSKPKPKKPAGPTEVQPDKDGVVILGKMKSDKYNPLDAGLRFEPAMHCVGCEHNRLAAHRKTDKPEPTCFNPPCFELNQRNGNREEGVAQWLDKRLLPLVEAKLTNNYDLQFQLFAWMALGAPTQTNSEQIVFRKLGTETRRVQKQQFLRTPGAVIQACTNQTIKAEAVAAAGVRALLADRGHFYAFARHLGIKLTPAIAHLDAEYVALKRKGELVEILHMAGFTESRTDSTTADAGKAADTKFAPVDKLKLDELVAVCLSEPVVSEVGIPPDVYALYQNIQPEIDPDTDEDFDDDEVSEETVEATDGEEDA